VLGRNMLEVFRKNEPYLRDHYKEKYNIDLSKKLDEIP
jgi:hypothetical protein